MNNQTAIRPELVFLDTETTDLKEGSKVIQLAYQYWGKIVNELINPEVPIWIWAMSIHHITDEEVADKPIFKKSLWVARLMTLAQNPDTIIVAHNAEFDIGMLKWEWVIIDKYICTKKLAETLREQDIINPESVSMQYLRYYFKCKFEQRIDPHDALSDIIVLRAVFEKLLPYFNNDIEEMLKISMRPIILKKIWFGKHKWKTFEYLMKNEKQYLDRLKKNIENEWDKNWKDKNVYHTILHHYAN